MDEGLEVVLNPKKMSDPKSKNNHPRICLVAHNAYGSLAAVDTGHAGGIERQTSLMARWFAGRGWDVSMITWDEGQPDGIEVDGIRVLKMCRRDAGLPGLRFLHPKWSSLCQAMKRADAEIYYYNCGDLGLGQVVMWCRRHGRQSVYSVASDPDCDVKLPVLKPLRERVLYQYGLRHVDSVIVQTQRQQQMLQEGFKVGSTVIPMPCLGLGDDGPSSGDTPHDGASHVLWVGRISAEKRFEWLLDIAEQCPEITFDVVGAANGTSEYASTLTKRAAGISNVNMHGRVPHDEVAGFYRRCRVLCCTSAYEGFPNTFLEAWSCGVPVVSTFDPDHVIVERRLGLVAQDREGIVSGLREMIRLPEEWLKASEAARQYYLKYHAPEVSLPRFEHLFLDVQRTDSRKAVPSR